eukprot:TRINITY_DN4403_c1_g1_i1.p1 TRINITY_DN4403_c1_g1~~TRINITY_DN4403_c1_g1_i1.p1  ORF type:complete len:167 (+),score=31.87 TRINITY_DN4403_c1_g1_i1:112-612(+)
MRLSGWIAAFMALSVTCSMSINVCPGEGDRYGDHKCNHDATHRVCAKLLGSDGTPLRWGNKDFWEITGQTSVQWDDEIRKNNGDSWCICMWATAKLVKQVGCANVHLRCDSTDVSYVMQKYTDGGEELQPAKQCLSNTCNSPALLEENATSDESLLKSIVRRHAPM